MFRRLRRTPSAASVLRATIDALPVHTREAMLAGIRSGARIVAGAYTDGHGGTCPMLAAHRRGARTRGIDFARAWDRYTGAECGGPVDATPEQLESLGRMLEASIAGTRPSSNPFLNFFQPFG